VAHGHIAVGEDKLRHSQLPSPIVTASGYALHHPTHWC
jgi:hypothetical protein